MSKSATSAPVWNVTPELPTVARTRSGIEFNPHSQIWSYRESLDEVSLNFSQWNVTDSFLISAKCTLLWYAE
jgi:hypothetical protein